MPFHPIRAFKDPVTRPRAIVWSGIAAIVFVILWAAALDVTSTYFFCTRPCHIVHDDNTLAYHQSSHGNVACVACHEPIGVNPLGLTLLKIEVAPDAIDTVLQTFELPMNHDNHIAEEMPSAQCTQCHNLKNRPVSPNAGILIDHDVHEQNGVSCPLCHNRIAHPEENITLVLAGDRKHDNWMTMDACFRCHGSATDALAPGACGACHPADFKLVPPSHEATNWYRLFGESGGHAQAAREESSAIAENIKLFEERPPDEPSHGEIEGVEPTGGLLPAAQVNTCYTCHRASFCSDCHRLPLPHSAAFKRDHGTVGYAAPETCGRCHARSAAEARGTGSCNRCHHPASTLGRPWIGEHDSVVRADDADPCFRCHTELDCSGCHVRGTALGREAMRERFDLQ